VEVIMNLLTRTSRDPRKSKQPPG